MQATIEDNVFNIEVQLIINMQVSAFTTYVVWQVIKRRNFTVFVQVKVYEKALV